MEEKYCQSCGMPMGNTEEMYGTEADGAKSKEYCKYCYENGKFVANCSMEEMIEFCVPHMVAAHKEISEASARKMIGEYFPKLKRWQEDNT